MKRLFILLISIAIILVLLSGYNVHAFDYSVPTIIYDDKEYTTIQLDELYQKVKDLDSKMTAAHEIAKNARILGYDDDSEIIKLAQEEWTKYSIEKQKYKLIVAKLEELFIPYTEDDVYWLAKIIQGECGSDWCSDELQLMVGNVVMNRLTSGKWGDTIYDVVHASGQYQPTWTPGWDDLQPSERAINNAKRLLRGERWCPKDVIWQANFKQGKETYWIYNNKEYNCTVYFCS